MRHFRMAARIVCATALLLALGGCGEGVDGNRRDLARDLVESIQTPDGFEKVTGATLTDPDLSKLTAQLGSAFQAWRPIAGEPDTNSVLSAFSQVFRDAGFIPFGRSRCSDEVLIVGYWHQETGPAGLSFGESATGNVSFTLFWDNDAPTVAEEEADLPSCP